jgi:DNA-binding transcriptional MerR regulator
MPFEIDGRTVYRIGEALRAASVSRATYFRWVREGLIADTEFRDRNGRRVLTAEELEHLKRFAHRLVESPQMRLREVR